MELEKYYVVLDEMSRCWDKNEEVTRFFLLVMRNRIIELQERNRMYNGGEFMSLNTALNELRITLPSYHPLRKLQYLYGWNANEEDTMKLNKFFDSVEKLKNNKGYVFTVSPETVSLIKFEFDILL